MAQDPAAEEVKANEKLSLASTVKLNDGTIIPIVGFGTYVPSRTRKNFQSGLKGVEDNEEDKLIMDSVTHAMKSGYTHIDSAQVYDTERLLMEGIKSAGKERKDVFITTKLSSTIRNVDEARKMIGKSVEALGGYVDLLLMHSPMTNNSGQDVLDCYKVMMDFHKEGKVKSIGVSNFHVGHLECFDKASVTLPSVNQIEIHPFLVEQAVVDYCNKKGIRIEAYSPIAQAKKLDDETLVAIGKKYNKSAAHVMLRWGLQKGFIILPKSTTPKRIESNVELFDFELSKDDIAQLDKLQEKKMRVSWNVINTVKWDEKLFVKK